MIFERGQMGNIHLSVKNASGSVEHYYHFLLGFLFPLVYWYGSVKQSQSEIQKIYIRSCAIFDRLILEIGLKNVVILERELHHSLASEETFQGEYIEHVLIDGFDHPRHYAYPVFSDARDLIYNCIQSAVNKEKSEIRRKTGSTDILILVIDRRPSDPYYFSEIAEIKTSGRDRRSVPNLDEIVNRLPQTSTVSVVLEDKSIAHQIALFSLARIVIAQHGACLANLVFCEQDSTLIEIVPRDLPKKTVEFDLFGALARTMGLRCVKVDQEHSHSPVSPEAVSSPVFDAMKYYHNH